MADLTTLWREKHEEDYSLAEEMVHAATHGAGALAGLIGLIVLLVAAGERGANLCQGCVTIFRTMPELPEVESVAITLRERLIGQRVAAAHTLWARTIAYPDPPGLAALLPGQAWQQAFATYTTRQSTLTWRPWHRGHIPRKSAWPGRSCSLTTSVCCKCATAPRPNVRQPCRQMPAHWKHYCSRQHCSLPTHRPG